MTTKMGGSHPILGILMFVLLFGFVIGALIYRKLTAPKQVARLHSTLFDPYFAELKAGHLDEAYQRFTTPVYKAKYSLEAYHKAWQERFDIGPLTKIQMNLADPGRRNGKWGFSMSYYVVLGDKKAASSIFYFVVEEGDGALRIEESAWDRGGGHFIQQPW